jgi:hypothetical protein
MWYNTAATEIMMKHVKTLVLLGDFQVTQRQKTTEGPIS